LGRDIVVRSVGLKYFVQKLEVVIQFVVTRKWNSRNPNLYLRPINLALLFSPAFEGEDNGEGGNESQKEGDID
jgi:hypothetical protein